ncbi:hypothetical protein HDV06_001827 [Boothiomyces sp. JEL0866]|nr:hypothetical protein HDV06_001827 [Boothiomyces sp. JEL0866]
MNLTTILASGPPADHLASGTAVCQQQKAAILVHVPHTAKFHSATVYLGTELLQKPNNNVTFSVCPSLYKPCLETASFSLPSTKRIEATWESTKNSVLQKGFVWFVVEGNSPSFDHSFTWFDAQNFNHTTAYNDGKWTIEKNRAGASTIKFIATTAQIYYNGIILSVYNTSVSPVYYSNQYYVADKYLYSEQTSDAHQCMTDCALNSACTGYTFKKTDQTCVFYDRTLDSLNPQDDYNYNCGFLLTRSPNCYDNSSIISCVNFEISSNSVTTPDFQSTNLGLIIGLCSAFIILAVTGVFFYIICRSKSDQKPRDSSTSDQSNVTLNTGSIVESVNNSPTVYSPGYYNQRFSSPYDPGYPYQYQQSNPNIPYTSYKPFDIVQRVPSPTFVPVNQPIQSSVHGSIYSPVQPIPASYASLFQNDQQHVVYSSPPTRPAELLYGQVFQTSPRSSNESYPIEPLQSTLQNNIQKSAFTNEPQRPFTSEPQRLYPFENYTMQHGAVTLRVQPPVLVAGQHKDAVVENTTLDRESQPPILENTPVTTPVLQGNQEFTKEQNKDVYYGTCWFTTSAEEASVLPVPQAGLSLTGCEDAMIGNDYTLFNFISKGSTQAFSGSSCTVFNSSLSESNVGTMTNSFCGFTSKSNLFSICRETISPPPTVNNGTTPTASSATDSGNSNGVNVGLVIGLIVALVLLVFILLAVFFYFYRAKRQPKPVQMSSQATLHDSSKHISSQYHLHSQPNIIEVSSSHHNPHSYSSPFDHRHSDSMTSYSQEFKPLELRSSHFNSHLDTNSHNADLSRNKTFAPSDSRNYDSFQPLELAFLERNKTYAPIRSTEEIDFPRYSLTDNQSRVDSFGRLKTLKHSESVVLDTLSKPKTLNHKETLITRASNPDTPILQQNLPDEPEPEPVLNEEDKQPRYRID